MLNNEIFWNYFKMTGRIGIYLLFKEITRDHPDIYSGMPRRKRKLG